MRFWVVAFLCVFVSFHSPASGNTPETRKALVIGNGAYGVSPLPNPINDAQAMTEALEMSGFDVTLATDLSYRDLQRAVVRFSREVRAAGEETVAMVYYAGHAVQANGENYLIPVDADIQDSLDLEIQSLRLSTVMQSLESAGNRLNLVVLDACRDNPFPSMSRSGSRGLAKVDAPYGPLLAYSTAPGDVAADGAGRNS
ncbi:MAG: caspase family protein, partial [Alphaproteobacteria bacterium]|nr:caspase family protein [Alphaproteobacteria bacterium]